MKLPNGDRAVVEESKLRDYCLSPSHPRGRHKARLFAATFGFTSAHVHDLKNALLAAARDGDAVLSRQNAFGMLYTIEFRCDGPTGTGTLLSVWAIDPNAASPRLVTCYPL